jgi:ABC-type nitrate/sulfonate/bicarbonate transport system ATPase subunit
VTVVRGPSGAGKTTLFRLLLGYRPGSRHGRRNENRKASVVFQEDRLLPWATPLENVALCFGSQCLPKPRSGRWGWGTIGPAPARAFRRIGGACDCARAGIRRRALLLYEPFTGLDEDNKRLVANEIQNGRPRLCDYA